MHTIKCSWMSGGVLPKVTFPDTNFRDCINMAIERPTKWICLLIAVCMTVNESVAVPLDAGEMLRPFLASMSALIDSDHWLTDRKMAVQEPVAVISTERLIAPDSCIVATPDTINLATQSRTLHSKAADITSLKSIHSEFSEEMILVSSRIEIAPPREI